MSTRRPLVNRRHMYLAIVLLAVLLVPLPALGEPQTHHVSIDAAQFEYSPPRLNVGRGDTVHVTLTASDTVHGFYLDGYGIDERVDPGLSKEFAFEADQTGKFKYRCSVACGPLHPFMIGELVVGPNEPLLRAIGLLVVLTLATLFSVRNRATAA